MRNLVITLTLSVTACVSAHAFSGKGTGTEKDPYQVTNADELFEVRNDLSAFYRQTDDIDLSEWIRDNNPSQGWMPIGSESTPFSGKYDGGYFLIKGLYINRPLMDYVGLFGYISNSEISRISILFPYVEGSAHVGSIVGGTNIEGKVILQNNVVIGGKIQGADNVGGISGSFLRIVEGYCNHNNETGGVIVEGCYCSSSISSNGTGGGICGQCNGEYNEYISGSHYYSVDLRDNRFAGTVFAEKNAGGIVGCVAEMNGEHYTKGGTYGGMWSRNGNYTICRRNIVSGSIKSDNYSGGIVGNYVYDPEVSSEKGTIETSYLKANLSVADTISGNKVYRISNYLFPDNYGWVESAGFQRGKPFEFDDDDYNGMGYGKSILSRQSTYEGLEFDFYKTWTMQEGYDLPFYKAQSFPVKVTEFTSSARSIISGVANGNGIVYIEINGILFQAPVVDEHWQLETGMTVSGVEAYITYVEAAKAPSVMIKVKSENKIDIPLYVPGDANGDGVVDAADVVGIINYIIGKPSASFNASNADVTGDGQVLVEDAVEAVALIMNAQ